MTRTAANFAAAVLNYETACATVDRISAAVDALHPEPADCTDDEWDAWNDRYETALMESGQYKAQSAKHRAGRELILAMVEYATETAGADSATVEAIQPAVVAATAEDKRFRYSAYTKMLDLAVKMAA